MKVSGSFRDPSGSVFSRDSRVFRQVNKVYREEYDLLMQGGLYEEAVRQGLLVEHREETGSDLPGEAYRIIEPTLIPWISYPYEWSFTQLKDAALATLALQKLALDKGMSLKDASAYNIQFLKGRPVFIDTLSFERYQEGEPWVAYRQFCQHFLAPLLLMCQTDIRLSQLMRTSIDGIPLDLAARLLPFSSRFRFSTLAHIHLHAGSQKKHADSEINPERFRGRFSRMAFTGLLNSLEGAVSRLKWQPAGTTWGDYYEQGVSYIDESLEHKKTIISDFLKDGGMNKVIDLGANTGVFSRIAAGLGISTLSCDIDPAAVEKNYLDQQTENSTDLLPLLTDLTNPSPALGWDHGERMSFIDRSPGDGAMALALVHHLAIGNNVPLAQIADFFSRLCRTLIIEFVPKDDAMVRKLLVSRTDIFSDYNENGFEWAFSRKFKTIKKQAVKNSCRTVYLMERLLT